MLRQHTYLHSLPHVLQVLLQHLLLFCHYSCCWMCCLSPLLQKGQGGHQIRAMTQERSPPSLRRFCGKGLHPLTKASAVGCSLAALAPGLRSTAHGTPHTPRKGREERRTRTKANSHPRQRAPRLRPGGKQLLPTEQKLSAAAAGPSLSAKRLSLLKEASGELWTAASLQHRVPAQRCGAGGGMAAPGHPSH